MLHHRWALLLRRLGLLLGIYLLLRLLFLICNHRAFAGLGVLPVLKAFLFGLRFDLSALVAINFPFILGTFLPWRSVSGKFYERLMKGIFLAVNIPFLIINIVDLEFFQFTGRRLTYQLLSLGGDAGVKWSTLLLTYWPLVLLGLFLIALLFLLYGKPVHHPLASGPTGGTLNQSTLAGRWFWGLNLLLIFPVAIIIFRGGLQWRPIVPAQAMALGDNGLAQLALNSSFTVLKTFRNKRLPRQEYFPDREELEILRPLISGDKSLLPKERRQDNIVILILESFSAEYWGAGNGGNRYTPFLDTLAERSLFFPRNYANGRASIEVMPSVLAGLPSLMEEPFIDSAFQNNELLGLGTILSRHGYSTSFYHGGKNGTMHFDTFMAMAGMRRYVGLNEYPRRSEDYDGTWGIYDEPFLQFTAAELTKQPQPFATAIFTLSSHHPYRVPQKYVGRFKKGTLPIHEAIGYTDYAVEQFFATAHRQPWYSNTLFIVTADHTQKLETSDYASILGHYRVPLLFFHPRGELPQADPARITQHVDILPSILDYLGIEPSRRLLFGQSVFQTSPGRAFLYVNGHYWMVRAERALEFLTEGPASKLYDLSKDPQLKTPVVGESDRQRQLEKEAKALIQYFNNGMLDNKLYDSARMTTNLTER